MELKTKKCRGLGLAAGYGCGEPVKHRKYGLGINCCYASWLYNSTEGKKLQKKYSLKGIKKVKVENDKIKKAKKEELKVKSKTIAILKGEAKTPFQKLIRIRDHRQNCISCGKKLPFELGAYDGGHMFKSELYSGVIFHPYNVNGQCVYCNQHLHGNEGEYNHNLPERIGVIEYHHLLYLKDKYKDHEWDRQTLIDLKIHYKKELRAVEKGIKDIGDVDFSVGILE